MQIELKGATPISLNPLDAGLSAPESVVRMIELMSQKTLDPVQEQAMLALVTALPKGATMRDLIQAIKEKESADLGITVDQYDALSPLFGVLEGLLAEGAYASIFATGKGKTPIADAHAISEAALAEYRLALDGELGADGDRFELICLHGFVGLKNVGLAFSAADQRAYLLFSQDNLPQPGYAPLWLLDAAKELTLFMRTMVVPDQRSDEATSWAGESSRPVTVYRFKLPDGPERIRA